MEQQQQNAPKITVVVFLAFFVRQNMDAFGVFRVVVACIMLIISLLINIPFEPEKHSKSPEKKTSTGSQ